MKKTYITVLASFLLAAAGHAAILLTPAGVTLTAGTAFYSTGNLVNNSGFVTPPTIDNYLTASHSTGATNDRTWVTNDPSPAGGDYFAENAGGNVVPMLTFDLGGSYDLTRFVYWGYDFTGNEGSSFILSFSTTGTGGAFSGDQSFTATTARGTATPGFFDLAPVTANAVRITITDNFNGDRVGLGEVKFVAVPEPATALLGCFGSLLLLRRRR